MRIISTKALKLDRAEIEIAISKYCKQKGYDINPADISFVIGFTSEKYPKYELNGCVTRYEKCEEDV